jgi:HAD superfamily hydrolase (TIGR01549 family)
VALPGIRHLCFDKDGVLTDVHSYWAHNTVLRAEAFAARHALPPAQRDGLVEAMGVRRDRIKPGGPVGYEPRPVVVEAVVSYLWGLGRKATPGEVADVFKEVDAGQQARGDYSVRVLPGVREFLARPGGPTLSIYSSDRAENTRRVLAELGLADRFAAVFGGGDVARPKPDPEGFLKACAAVGVPPGDSAYVGDTASDLRMARAGGARLRLGVTTGLDARETLEAEADRVVDRLDELL